MTTLSLTIPNPMHRSHAVEILISNGLKEGMSEQQINRTLAKLSDDTIAVMAQKYVMQNAKKQAAIKVLMEKGMDQGLSPRLIRKAYNKLSVELLMYLAEPTEENDNALSLKDKEWLK